MARVCTIFTAVHPSYVVAANHQSLYDIFVLYGWLGIDIQWVMKIELRKVPIIGYIYEKMDHIYIDRSDSNAAVASINRAKNKISGGVSVIFLRKEPETPREHSENSKKERSVWPWT